MIQQSFLPFPVPMQYWPVHEYFTLEKDFGRGLENKAEY